MVASPGVYPRGGPRPTTSHAEQFLYRCLQEQLPEGWIAWHSLRVRGDRGWEGEGDFVVAVPNRGVLVLEVKGGAIEVRGGQWLQNGMPMRKVPRDQAHNFARLLRLKLGERGLLERELPRKAIVTVFPDTPFSEEPSEGAVEGACLGQQDMPTLGKELHDIAERLLSAGTALRERKWIDGLHALWCETWTPTLKLGDRTRLREQELVALDAKQLEVLDLVAPNPRLLVCGGAGTGKTLVAREVYERLIEPLKEQGREPLYLCSTNALAAGLRSSGITNAWTVREHAAQLLERAGISMQGGAHRSAWKSETWELAPLAAAADAVPKLGPRYGAVVVDEGQDMTESDWELVQALAGTGILWVFADTGQSFWPDRGVPRGLLPASVSLTKRYRCPEPLARFADLYRYDLPPDRPSVPTIDLAPGPAEPDAPPPRPSQASMPTQAQLAAVKPFDELNVVQIPSDSVLTEKVALEIGKAASGGASAWDIAVLSLAGQTRTKIGVASRIKDRDVVRADDARAGKCVVADTFLRFKGLERPWIIVTELSLATDRYDVRMHVALTRATVGCVVLATREEIAADPRLKAACR